MKRRTRLLLSVISGVCAVVLALLYGASIRAEAAQAQQEALARYGGDLVSVCVATRDIDPGEELGEDNVHVEEWVASLLPDDAARSIADVAGERATSSIPAHAVICPVYTAARTGAIEVPKGMVAVSVPASDESAVGGAVGAGDQVDVYVSDNGVADRLCRATVIDTSAAGQDAPSGEIAWVTLAVEPERVSEVLAATGSGSVSLVLPDAAAADEGGQGADAGDEGAVRADEGAES